MKRVDNKSDYISSSKRIADTSLIDIEFNQLLNNQLETNADTIGFSTEQPNLIKEFTEAAPQINIISSVDGLCEAHEYKELLDVQEKVNGMFHDGLSSNEVLFLLNIDTNYEINFDGMRKNPLAIEREEFEIARKLSKKRDFVDQQSTFNGTKLISRHEYELEMSAYELNSNPLKHLLGIDPKLNNNNINNNNNNNIDNILSDSLHAVENRSNYLKIETTAKVSSIKHRSDNLKIVSDIIINTEDTAESIRTSKKCNLERMFLLSEISPLDSNHVKNYKLTLEEIRNIKLFSTYDPGPPTNKLFVKNLHRNVTLYHLASLFICFQLPEGPPIKFRLLNGKMKGQAFVEFSTKETAKVALEYATGYILYGRPVIAVYAKSVNTVTPH